MCTLDELDALRHYRAALQKLGISATHFEHLDLENESFWLFQLSGFMSEASVLFDTLNEKYFSGELVKPSIVYSSRSTGGYYHYGRNEIGISTAMTIEYGKKEFMETFLHEIAHMKVKSHGPRFHTLLKRLGGSGKRAPMTELLRYKREQYGVHVECPNCKQSLRYRTKRALHYACKRCCEQFNGGKFDRRFKLQLVH